VLENFKVWLLDAHTEDEADKFKSFVSSILKAYNLDDSIDLLKAKIILEDLTESLNDLKENREINIHSVTNLLKTLNQADNVKDLNDYRSGWWLFIEYLILSSKNSSTISPQSKLKGYRLPHLDIPYGPDESCNYVRYDSDVPLDKRIPGLCSGLETEYERIIAFAAKFFSNTDCNIKDISRIPVILKKGIPDPIVYPLNAFQISRVIENIFKLKEPESDRSEIFFLINSLSLTLSRCGCYYPGSSKEGDGPHIEIYFECYDDIDYDMYLAAVIQTLVHEYMYHIYHICKSDDPSKASVYESLAETFSVLYLISTKETLSPKTFVAEERCNFWKRYFMVSTPCTASYLRMYNCSEFLPLNDTYEYYEKNGAIKRFLNQFTSLLKESDEALKR